MMRELEDLELLIKSSTPLVFVDTVDAQRCEELFLRLARREDRVHWRWSQARGLSRSGADTGAASSALGAGSKPQQVLAQILAQREPGLWLLFDVVPHLEETLVASQLREIALRHAQIPHTLLLAGAGASIPESLRTMAARLELALPSAEELSTLIHEEAAAWGAQQQKRVQATAPAIAALARNLLGLTHADARRLVRTAIRDDGLLDEGDLPAVMEAKYRLLDTGGVLSFELKTTGMDEVAGLANLKRWLTQRKPVFLAEEPQPGLDIPKGVLLLGVQGAGKSLAAKSIAGAWGVPLLRLDFATLYNKYYGETERNLRESLRTAAVMAPCVLWIDEIEKGLASEDDDGGPGKRILGTLLTWMAERKDRTFLVATANDIQALPPELLRKGRFDEIFFVDLPSPEVRQAIFTIHLRRRGANPADFDLHALAIASEGFAGAEIEQAVVSALYASKARNESLQTQDVVDAIRGTKPLSVVMAEKIAWLRAWARERTVSAD